MDSFESDLRTKGQDLSSTKRLALHAIFYSLLKLAYSFNAGLGYRKLSQLERNEFSIVREYGALEWSLQRLRKKTSNMTNRSLGSNANAFGPCGNITIKAPENWGRPVTSWKKLPEYILAWIDTHWEEIVGTPDEEDDEVEEVEDDTPDDTPVGTVVSKLVGSSVGCGALSGNKQIIMAVATGDEASSFLSDKVIGYYMRRYPLWRSKKKYMGQRLLSVLAKTSPKPRNSMWVSDYGGNAGMESSIAEKLITIRKPHENTNSPYELTSLCDAKTLAHASHYMYGRPQMHVERYNGKMHRRDFSEVKHTTDAVALYAQAELKRQMPEKYNEACKILEPCKTWSSSLGRFSLMKMRVFPNVLCYNSVTSNVVTIGASPQKVQGSTNQHKTDKNGYTALDYPPSEKGVPKMTCDAKLPSTKAEKQGKMHFDKDTHRVPGVLLTRTMGPALGGAFFGNVCYLLFLCKDHPICVHAGGKCCRNLLCMPSIT